MRYIDLIGIPCGLGNYVCPGSRDGPDILRRHIGLSLVKCGRTARYIDLCRLSRHPEWFDAHSPSRARIQHEKKIRMIGGLATLQVFRSLIVGNTPVVLGGDNSFSAFTISAAARKFIREGKTPGLLYIDAHLDVHTEKTTWTGHAHGMPLAAVVGEGRLAFRSSKHYLNKNGELRRRIDRTALSPQNVIHIGAGSTDIEPEEFAFIDKHRIRMYDLKSLREAKGWNECFNEISRLASRVDKLIVMLDLDVFHQSIAPGVAYQSESGLTSAEWPQLIDHIRASAKGKIAHVEIMEYNPSKDVTDEAGIPKTARLASEVLTRLIT